MKRIAALKLLVSLGALAATLAAYGAWFRYVSATTDRIAAITERIERATTDQTRSRDARDQLAALAEDERVIQAAFVSTEDVVPFLETLERTGETLGAQVEVVSVAAATEPRPRLTISLSLAGSFDAVLRTLGAVEYAPVDVELTTLTLDTPQGSGVWNAALTIVVGTAPAPAPATP